MKPWKTEKAMREIIDSIPVAGRVFEWGSGGSVIQMATERPKATIFCVEHDPFWTSEVVKHQLPNLIVIHITNPDEYVEIPLLLGRFDVLINDGVHREAVNNLFKNNMMRLLKNRGKYYLHDYESVMKGVNPEFSQEAGLENLPGTYFYTVDGSSNDQNIVSSPELGVIQML